MLVEGNTCPCKTSQTEDWRCKTIQGETDTRQEEISTLETKLEGSTLRSPWQDDSQSEALQGGVQSEFTVCLETCSSYPALGTQADKLRPLWTEDSRIHLWINWIVAERKLSENDIRSPHVKSQFTTFSPPIKPSQQAPLSCSIQT